MLRFIMIALLLPIAATCIASDVPGTRSNQEVQVISNVEIRLDEIRLRVALKTYERILELQSETTLTAQFANDAKDIAIQKIHEERLNALSIRADECEKEIHNIHERLIHTIKVTPTISTLRSM
ncbi:MAG: hypothetical protein AAGC97_10555 [Planctomycetota bacterium]